MTKDQLITKAKALGYKLMPSNAYEVKLVKNNQRIKKWRAEEFNNIMPTLDNPKVQEVISLYEEIA